MYHIFVLYIRYTYLWIICKLEIKTCLILLVSTSQVHFDYYECTYLQISKKHGKAPLIKSNVNPLQNRTSCTSPMDSCYYRNNTTSLHSESIGCCGKRPWYSDSSRMQGKLPKCYHAARIHLEFLWSVFCDTGFHHNGLAVASWLRCA